MAGNPRVPAISQPIADVRSLSIVTAQLREGVESLGGLRGDPLDRAVTFNDLIAMGLISRATAVNMTK